MEIYNKMKSAKYLLLTAFLAAAATGCKPKTETVEVEREELVETTVLSNTEVERVLDFSTTLEGYQTMSVAPSLTGRIEHIFVEVGSRVGTGSMLVRMDQQQYNTAKLTYSNLEIELSRMEALVETGAVSQQSFDQIKLSHDQTAENLQFLEKNTYVKAQFPGVISAKNYEDGELYSGQAILTLTQINVLKALVSVPESYYPQVQKGMSVNIESDIYPGEVFPATVEIVYPTIDPASHTFQLKVKIPNGGEKLRPGMYVHTTLALGKAEALIVPYNSVQKLTGSNERYVYLNDNGVAKRVFVTLGQRFDDKIEVIAPEITEGVEVITTGSQRLVDGVKIKLKSEE